MARVAVQRALEPEVALQSLAALDLGVIVLGRGGDVRYLNPAAQELFEERAEDAVGEPLGSLIGLAPDGPLGPKGEAWETFALPATQILTQCGEKELALACRMLPLGRKSRPDGALLLVEDISESADEQAFQRNIDRFSSMGSLSAVIAHEIRNPLTGIRTTIQFVETKLPPASPLRSDLDDAIKEIDRIEQFTTDLLQFARPKIVELQPAHVNEIVEKVLANVTARCEEQSVQVRRELSEDLPLIPLDGDAIQQALLNIVINALDAMPGGGTLRISSSTRRYRSRRAVEIAVADTGTGIPAEIMEKVFDPFFTTRGSGGTGLGLSIALQVVREHFGRIYVRNRQQGGTIFRLSFPMPEDSEGMVP
jgi:signal transduction histidine kinase